MKKILTLIMALVMMTLVFTGCVSEGAEGDAASDENTLNIYTALEDDIIEEYLKDFKAENPDVKINITRDSTGVITAKLLAEKENPQADVVWGTSAASLLVLKSNEMLEPYAPEGVDKILPQFKDDAEVPAWVGIDAWETAFLVNKDVLAKKGVKKIPESYDDLTDPMYKDMIAMSNPESSGTGLLTVNGVLTLKGEKEGWDYLDKLHKNVNTYLHSGSAPAKNTAAGEYGIGISFGYRCIESAKDLGDKGTVVFPKEGCGWDVEANALMKRPDGNKEIAKKFLDWAISEPAMEKYKVNYPILATGVAGSTPEGYAKDPVDQLIKEVDLQWCADNREDILKEWNKRYDSKSEPEEE